MFDLTLSEISKIIDGELYVKSKGSTNHTISNLFTDSRIFSGNAKSIFFAIVGPRNNGHLYIPELENKGINAFVISEKQVIHSDSNFILVRDTVSALQKLASFHRNKYKYPVIGITGSNGKTVIKEWLSELLNDEFKIIRNPKSYNSQIGVPLSVLLMKKHFNLGIFEAGISQPGEMENLASIISPEIGIFTNIGDAHQENFSSVQQKINEKLKLFRNCKQLIYSADNKIYNKEIQNFYTKNNIEGVSWSIQNNPAALNFTIQKKQNYSQISLKSNAGIIRIQLPFTDDSSIENLCHCLAAVLVLVKNPKPVFEKFRNLGPVEMRLEIKQGINNCLLVNDVYNSDLNSLSIALSVLQQQAAKEHLKKLLILSDIQQSGFSSTHLYQKVNELLKVWKIDKLIGIGEIISKHRQIFSCETEFFESTAAFEKKFSKQKFASSAILIKGARQFTLEKISDLLQQKAHQTRLEIDLNALTHNLNIYKGLLKKETKIMVMVKAFSYGSGDVEIANLLQHQKVDYLAVAVSDEGVQLRNAGISIPIVVMNPERNSFQHMIDYQLEPNIYSFELLQSFASVVAKNGIQNLPVHLKIDTGMNRLGIKTKSETKKVISFFCHSSHLKLKSVFTHLAGSDEETFDSFTNTQFERFNHLYAEISDSIGYFPDRHLLNSAGIERFPEKQFEMVRLGIGLYGSSVSGLKLQNVGTLKSTISQVKKVFPGETIGYSRKGKVESQQEIAVVPMGYADGLDRKLGNKNGIAFINGKTVAIVGNICMDMLMLDVTGLQVKTGDEVEFFGPNISISEVAQRASTIHYEILTGISQRVKRIYLQE